MATNGSPTVIEPTTPSVSPLPKVPGLSTNRSSSSGSFDSSRPTSQPSSTTSRSVSPSPLPKSVPAIDSHESIELPALPSIPPLPENILASEPQRRNEPPRSEPPALAVSPGTGSEATWLYRLGYLIPTGVYFTNILGALSLGLALIGMIVFGRLTILTAWNDALANCAQLTSLNTPLGPNCEWLLSENKPDVTLPPYKHWKRILKAKFEVDSEYSIAAFVKQSTLSFGGLREHGVNSSLFNFSSAAIVLASSVIIGGLSLIVFRRYWRKEEVFTSPVRSDYQFTWHHQEGPETVSGEGYRVIRRNPEDSHPLGQLRQHIRRSQPNAVENPTGETPWHSQNTSEDTLVSPWKNTRWGSSKVSLTMDTSDEKHENLIELETKGPSKTFFDPETGEFIHLTPWKSTGDEEVHGLKPDGKGSIKRAFAQMTLGATGWAGGKNIDDQLAEELQANSKGVEKEPEEPTAGDGITGSMINESPAGKPTIV